MTFKKSLMTSIVVVVVTVIAVSVVFVILHPRQDELTRMVAGEASFSAGVDVLVCRAENITTVDEAGLARGELAAFIHSRQKRLAADKESRAALIYAAILCAAAQDKWAEVRQFAEYAKSAGLDSTLYWPAICLYEAEYWRTRDPRIAIYGYRDLLSEPVPSLLVVSPDCHKKEAIGDIAKRRIRQLTFGEKVIWVVDSHGKKRDLEVARKMQVALGVKCEARGGWAIRFLYPNIYFRDTRDQELSVGEVNRAYGVATGNKGGPWLQPYSTSRSKTVRRLFGDNPELACLVIL